MKTITYNPETHVLVPREPSEEMNKAAAFNYSSDEYTGFTSMYKAMLAAAPQPEPNPNWCAGCSPDNCSGCGAEPVDVGSVGWKHDCAALCANDIELWIDRCPHCGKPRHNHPPTDDELLNKAEQVESEPAMWVMKHIRSGDLAQAKPNQKALHPYMLSDAFPLYTTPQPDRVTTKESYVELDIHSNPSRTEQQRKLDGSLEVGQLLGNGQNQETSHSKTVGDVILTDTFRGDDSALIDSIVALVSLDRAGVLVPHGIGGHARSLLESAAIRLSQPDRVAELEAALNVARAALMEYSNGARGAISKLRARVAELEERRCEVCGYAEHHREHTGCLRKQVSSLKAELREICVAIDDPACDLTLTAVECIKKLKAENASLKRDTERYQWLKSQEPSKHDGYAIV